MREFFKAAIEDAVHHFLPLSSLRTAFMKFVPQWLWAPEFFLRWDPSFATNYYHVTGRPCVTLRVGRDVRVLPQVLELDATAQPSLARQIIFEPSEDLFVADPEIIGLTDRTFKRYRWFLRLRRRRYTNDLLGRLRDVIRLDNGTVMFRVQPVRYEVVCRTHLCLDAEEQPGAQTLRKVVHKNGCLPQLSKSRLAEPLGVNFLLLTADGRLVLPKRSRKVVVRPGELSPSFSGDFNYADFGRQRGSLSSLQLLREGFEELGISPGDVPVQNMRFLGLTRELVRGGKPEMFFVAQTTLTEDGFRLKHSEAPDKWEFASSGRSWVFWQIGIGDLAKTLNDEDKYQLRTSVEKLISNEGSKLSLPLLTNLALLLHSKLG